MQGRCTPKPARRCRPSPITSVARARGDRERSVFVEAFAPSSHVDEDRRGGPSLAEAHLVAAHAAKDLRGAERIDVAERPAAERRKAEPEDRADVAVARAPQNAFLEAEERFVHELQR